MWRRAAIGVLLATFWCAACGSNDRSRQETFTQPNVRGHSRQQEFQRHGEDRGIAGNFDYYVLALSWAPTFCENPEHRRTRECDPRENTGFVVHGLWPQRQEGRSPEYCGNAQPLSEAAMREALTMMPDAGLVKHEWQAHGTCSGLSPQEYFDAMKRARQAVQIPALYRSPQRGLRTSAATIEAHFAQASGISQQGAIRVHCARQELAEVRFCFSKTLSPQPCTEDVGECRANPIFMRPVR